MNMDSNAALALLVRLSEEIDSETTTDYEGAVLAEEMAIAFDGLNQWIVSGGALPDAWQKIGA
jgi:hypothetical protein